MHTVRVGYFAFDGYHMQEDGVRSGYGYEILQHMAGYTNWKYEYVGYEKSWNEMQEMLERGEIDLLTSAQMTEERMERFDFSKESIGTSSAILSVKAGNKDFMMADYQNWSGMRVGMIQGNSRNQDFDDFAKEHGFTYSPVYYDDTDEMVSMLKTGDEVDAILTSNLRRVKDEWILAQFSSSPFYIMVQKGNTELLNEINHVLSTMYENEPGLRTKLMNKYYTPANGDEIAFTLEERAFIEANKNKTFTALLNPDRIPFSYMKDGKMTGIIYDISQEIIKSSQLDIRLEELDSGDEYGDKRRNRDADILFDAGFDYAQAENEGYRLTKSYLDASISQLYKKGNSKSQSVALLKDSDIALKYKDYFEENYQQVVYYDSIPEIIKAISEGKQDAAYLYHRTAQAAVQDDVTKHLITKDMYGFETFFSVAVNEEQNPLLFSILNKAVASIGAEEVEYIDRKYTSYQEKPFSLVGFVYEYPIAVMGIALSLCMFILLGAGLIFFAWKRRIEYTKLIEEKRRNELLQTALAAAESANAAKSTFLSRMSHEMRTPLNAIIGFMELTKGAEQTQIETYLTNSELAARQLLAIINDVLDMSSIEAGKMRLSDIPFRLPRLLDEIAKLYSSQCRQKNLEFELKIKTSLQEWLVGDNLRVNQILMNLLNNAVKFTEKGHIWFTVSQYDVEDDNVFIRFEVSDTGCGMSEELKLRLFRPFEQESAATAQRYGGSGLGLSIVKSLVGMMEGAIRVESHTGEGTTFTVDLPFKPCDEKRNCQIPTEKQTEEGFAFTGKRILLAEDNEMNRMIAFGLVERLGIVCDCAVDGMEAVEMFTSSKPGTYDAILMDIQMPRMDGRKATEEIRKSGHPDGERISIIALTANAFNEDIARMLSSGMNDHVAKPIDPEMLSRSLERAFRKQK